MKRKKKTSPWLYILLVLGVLFLATREGGRSGLPVILITEAPAAGMDAVDFRLQITTPNFRGLHLVVDGQNYSLYDQMILNYGFNNIVSLGENDSVIRDMSDYGPNGTPMYGLNWSPYLGYDGTGGFNFTGNSTKENGTWYPPMVQLMSPGWPAFDDSNGTWIGPASDNWTVSLRFYANGYSHTADTEAIINVYGDWDGFLRHYNSGSISYNIRNSTLVPMICPGRTIVETHCDETISGGYTGTLGVWHYVTMRRSPGNASNYTNWSIFMDGHLIQQQISHNNGSLFISRTYPLEIGGLRRAVQDSMQGLPFNGSMDDLIIVNRSLTDAEVLHASYSSLVRTGEETWTYHYTAPQMSDGTYTYSVCVTNTDGDQCTNNFTLTTTTHLTNITLNADRPVTRLWAFTGSNVHYKWLTNATTIYKDNVTASLSNRAWHETAFLDSGLQILRIDSVLNSGNYYFGCPNCDLEYWNESRWNDSEGTQPPAAIPVAKGQEYPQAWQFGGGSSTAATITNTSLSTSGKQAVLMCYPGAAGSNVWNYIDVNLPAGHTYTAEVDMKTWTARAAKIVIENQDHTEMCWRYDGYGDGLYHTQQCNTNILVPGRYRVTISLVTAGQCVAWDHLRLYQDGQPWIPVPNSDAYNYTLDLNAWAYAHNKTAMQIISYMPRALANITANCDPQNYMSAGDRCAPHDYAEWGLWVRRWVNATTVNGKYLPNVIFEVWNEPDVHFWLPGLADTDPRKCAEYNRLYNATYDAIKADWPHARIGGPASTHYNAGGFFGCWLQNIRADATHPVKADFVSIHIYGDNAFVERPLVEDVKGNVSDFIRMCRLANVPCDPLYVSEFNSHNPIRINDTPWVTSQYVASYIAGLYTQTANLSFVTYQWSEKYPYLLDSANTSALYGEYPHRFAMVSEAGLDHADASLYSTYNATRWMNTFFAPDTILVNTTTQDPLLYVAAVLNGTRLFTVISNTGLFNQTVGIGITPPTGHTVTALVNQYSGAQIAVTNNRAALFVPAQSVVWLEAVFDDQSALCISQWQCGNWSLCGNGEQTKTCVDTAHCATPSSLLTEPTTQSCGPAKTVVGCEGDQCTSTSVSWAWWLIAATAIFVIFMQGRRWRSR